MQQNLCLKTYIQALFHVCFQEQFSMVFMPKDDDDDDDDDDDVYRLCGRFLTFSKV